MNSIDRGEWGKRDAVLVSLRELAEPDRFSAIPLETHRKIRDWIYSYLLKTHDDLGRPGLVCPFTAHAARIDTVRIATCEAESGDMASIEDMIAACFRAFEDIPCESSMRAYRTVLIAFPRLCTESELDVLHKIQARIKLSTLRKGLMTAVFHEGNEAPGLWNPAFRPLQAPIPMFVIRQLVANDAPFVAAHPLLLPTYLSTFPIAGSRRLISHFWKKLRR